MSKELRKTRSMFGKPKDGSDKQPPKPSLYDIVLSTGFGFGFWPWGPGTAGTFLAVAIWCCYAYVLPSTHTLLLTAVLVVVSTLAAAPSINRIEKFWGSDPSRVVVDEMAGVWITLLAVPETKEWYYVLAAFILFRVMDICKPLGCRWLDKNIHGGWGVMLDDILAGVYGGVVLYCITLL